jgi:hypothetical protein
MQYMSRHSVGQLEELDFFLPIDPLMKNRSSSMQNSETKSQASAYNYFCHPCDPTLLHRDGLPPPPPPFNGLLLVRFSASSGPTHLSPRSTAFHRLAELFYNRKAHQRSPPSTFPNPQTLITSPITGSAVSHRPHPSDSGTETTDANVDWTMPGHALAA